MLLITNSNSAHYSLDTRVYHLNVRPGANLRELMEMIEFVLSPFESADEQTDVVPEGAGAKLFGKTLLVRHNRRAHNRLLDFFAQMDLDVSESRPVPGK